MYVSYLPKSRKSNPVPFVAIFSESFLPGQEAGNVNVVLDGGFGAFHKNPKKIASTLSEWIQDEGKLDEMSRNSMKVGNPTAASDIVQDIYNISMEKMLNEGIQSTD